jgi:tRNA 5-methylaminomethyl-2-thiouridine biosynthesis bifunctional protein
VKQIGHSISHILIVGAGIAGASAAYACAMRGMRVTVLERHGEAAAEASGNPAGILYPFMAVKWDAATVFYLQGFAHTVRLLKQLEPLGARFSLCGMQHYPKQETAAERERLQRLPASLGLDADVATPTDYGMFLPHSGWVQVPDMVRALLQHPAISLLPYHEALAVRYREQQWLVQVGEREIAADAMILANAWDAAALFPSHTLPMRRIRGQITYLPSGFVGEPVTHVLCYGGYLTPAIEGIHYLGATFDHGRTDIVVETAGHAANIAVLRQRFPGLLAPEIPVATLQGRAALRTVSGDRWPIVGALQDEQAEQRRGMSLPRLPQCYVTLAHGARGIVSAPLAGEMLASQIAGDIALGAIGEVNALLDPSRFILRSRRKMPAITPSANRVATSVTDC